MHDWLDELQHLAGRGEDAILVSLVALAGSAPREVGAKLVVTETRVWGSIGGGNLEYRAIAEARARLAERQAGKAIESYPLGPDLGQCCGGRVELGFEPVGQADQPWIAAAGAALRAGDPAVLMTDLGLGAAAKTLLRAADLSDDAAAPAWLRARAAGALAERRPCLVATEEGRAVFLEPLVDARQEVWLFGAGHVGRALVEVLDGLAFRVVWIDSRQHEFPERRPDNVEVRVSAAPVEEVESAPAGAFFLVMTHSHALDQAICEAVLAWSDFGFLGLIGSATKKERFLRRLAARGLPADMLTKLTCPIGLAGVPGKRPKEIAVAVAGQLLQLAEDAERRAQRDGTVKAIS
jgi:xanthine dehydrogenase accessory factor